MKKREMERGEKEEMGRLRGREETGRRKERERFLPLVPDLSTSMQISTPICLIGQNRTILIGLNKGTLIG